MVKIPHCLWVWSEFDSRISYNAKRLQTLSLIFCKNESERMDYYSGIG